MSLSKLGSIIYESVSIMIEKFSFLNLGGRYYPDWLEWLRGESPLLGRAEWNFITDVQNQIIQEARSRPRFTPDVQLRNKLSLMKDNFSQVVQYLKVNSRPNQYFVANYPQWRKFRDRTISQLKNIAKSVENNRRENAEARQASSSLSLAGGLICLATGAGVIGLVGKALIGLGSLSSIAASVSEVSQLRKMIKEAEQAIQLDKEYSDRLWGWISDLSHIQDALDRIQNINVDTEMKKTARDLYSCFNNKSTPEELKTIIARAVKSLKCSPETIIEMSDVIGILIAIAMLSERYRPLFHQALEAYKCYKTLSTACSVVAATFKVASGGLPLNHFRKSRIFTCIALDAINIILASKDLESTSKEAEEIVKAAEKLKEEAKVFQRLYDKVRHL